MLLTIFGKTSLLNKTRYNVTGHHSRTHTHSSTPLHSRYRHDLRFR